MPVTQDRPAPYAPASAVLDLIARYRTRGLPQPINADVLGRAGVSPSLTPRTLYALQVLDLIDEAGEPTALFDGLRRAPESEFKQQLADWLRTAYADVFAFVDLETDDDTRIRDAFRSYNPIGQQGRMVTLFQGLCTAAGLRPPKDTQAPATASPRRPSPRRSAPPLASRKSVAGARPTSATDLPPALSGLLTSLPSRGWSKTDRDKFLQTFAAVVDFCYPLIEDDEHPNDESGGQG